MYRWLAALGLAGGCHLPLGLDEVAPPDEPTFVTGVYRHRFTSNDSTYAPELHEDVLPPGAFALSATLDDGTKVTVDYAPDGTFSFPIKRPGQRYRLLTANSGVRHELTHDAPHLEVGYVHAGRYELLPQQPTRIQFAYPAMTTGLRTAHIATTGVFTMTDTFQWGPTVTFDWRLATPLGGAPIGLLSEADHDRVYVMELESATLANAPAYTRIRGVSEASITQSFNSTHVLAAPAPVAANTCMHIRAPNLVEHERITRADPREYVSSSGDWVAYMAPAPEHISLAGALYPAISGYAGIRDLDITPSFHDPFVGMTLVGEVAIAASFQVTLPGAAPLQMSNITRIFNRAARGANTTTCEAPVTELAATGALAGNVEVGGVALDEDGKAVDLDLANDVAVRWHQLSPGRVDSVSVTLRELIVLNGVTTQVVMWNATAIGTDEIRLDAALFEPGHSYMIGITSSVGRPFTADGNMLAFQLPFENALMWSRWFTVQAASPQ